MKRQSTHNTTKKSNTYLVADFSNIEKRKEVSDLNRQEARKKLHNCCGRTKSLTKMKWELFFFRVAKKKCWNERERNEWNNSTSRGDTTGEDNETRDRAHRRSIWLVIHILSQYYLMTMAYLAGANSFLLGRMSRVRCRRCGCSSPRRMLLPRRHPHVLEERWWWWEWVRFFSEISVVQWNFAVRLVRKAFRRAARSTYTETRSMSRE